MKLDHEVRLGIAVEVPAEDQVRTAHFVVQLPRNLAEGGITDESEVLQHVGRLGIGVDRREVDLVEARDEVEDRVGLVERLAAVGLGEDEGVGAFAAAQQVDAGAADQQIVAGTTVQRVVAEQTFEVVVARAARQDVGEVVAEQRVVVGRAGQVLDADVLVADRLAESALLGAEIRSDRRAGIS